MARGDSQNSDLLRRLCEKHGVPSGMVEDMIEVEKRHQFQERRHGIYDELAGVIKNAMQDHRQEGGGRSAQ